MSPLQAPVFPPCHLLASPRAPSPPVVCPLCTRATPLLTPRPPSSRAAAPLLASPRLASPQPALVSCKDERVPQRASKLLRRLRHAQDCTASACVVSAPVVAFVPRCVDSSRTTARGPVRGQGCLEQHPGHDSRSVHSPPLGNPHPDSWASAAPTR
ncbi:hypothetical protein IQ07DRAFT_41942 [Pyrenochaeta sp. DS3sAY3a]|nr:hypothetical protein IQ07DRAFT_41942 [Pyrenochaeta sp. DS3sAY3a]